jgi:hypothetical protein
MKEMFLRNNWKSPAEPHGYPAYGLDTNTLNKWQYVMRIVIGTYLEAMRRIFDMDTATSCEPEYRRWYSDLLGTGRSGDRIPVGGEIFRTRLDRPWVPPRLLYNGYQLSFAEIKRAGRWVDHPLPSSATVKERVELQSSLPLGLRGLF